MADPLVCYLVSNDVVTSTNQYFPCGSSDISGASSQACCNAGDYCMENSICHYTRGGVTNGTGYYMGGCTDSTWKDPACPKQCTSEFRPDIIYDRSSTEWRCCDSTAETLDCQNPSDFVVKAPDPAELSTVIQISAPAPSSTAATSITAITSIKSTPANTSAKTAKPTNTTSKASPANTDQSTAGLSSGAKAGIGFGIITLVVVLIGVFLFFRIRSAKPKNEKKKHKSEESRALPNPFRQSGAFTALSSRANSIQPSPALESPFASRRDSEFPERLQEPKTVWHKKQFSYDIDVGPYEMETPGVHQRVPYERPLSAQELEGTKVLVQELPANRPESGLRIETPESGLRTETPDDHSDAGTLNLDSIDETPDKDR